MAGGCMSCEVRVRVRVRERVRVRFGVVVGVGVRVGWWSVGRGGGRGRGSGARRGGACRLKPAYGVHYVMHDVMHYAVRLQVEARLEDDGRQQEGHEELKVEPLVRLAKSQGNRRGQGLGESATLEADGSCGHSRQAGALEAGRGLAPSGLTSPHWECRAAQSRQARPEEAQEPS